VKRVKEINGKAYKFSSPMRSGVPDRVCVFDNGVLIFVECKRPGAKPTPLQQKEMNFLSDLGHLVTWVSSKESIDSLIKTVFNMIKSRDHMKQLLQ